MFRHRVLRADHGQTIHNPVREGLPTIHPELRNVWGRRLSKGERDSDGLRYFSSRVLWRSWRLHRPENERRLYVGITVMVAGA